MNSRLWVRIAFHWVVILTCLCASVAYAAWPPIPNGRVAVSEAPYSQMGPSEATDGDGGVIIAWTDSRSGGGIPDIYAQRVDRSGVVCWTTDGVAVCVAPGYQANPVVVSDGSGGAFIVWIDLRDQEQLRAQRLDASGQKLWAQEALVSSFRAYNYPSACADGSGGILVAWPGANPVHSDTATSFPGGIFVQRLDGSGARLWAHDVAATQDNGPHSMPTTVSDGSGGAIVIWGGGDSAESPYAQRVTSDGVVAWGPNGIALPAVVGYQHDACSDGAGGVVVAWSDFRSNLTRDIYAQRIDASGRFLWGSGGLPVMAGPGSRARPSLIADNSGGAFIACEDFGGSNQTVSAQHILGNGTLLWASAGLQLGASGGYQQAAHLAPDGKDGVFVAWEEWRSPSTGWDLYGQHVSREGELLWNSEGAAIEVLPDDSGIGAMVSNGGKGAILTWNYALSTASNIYAQLLGESAPPSPPPHEKHPKGIVLAPARPNPTPGVATLRFNLSQATTLTLAIHDEHGRIVRHLLTGSFPAGEQTYGWDGRDDQGRRLPSGVYFVKLDAGGERQSRTITLMH